MDLFGQELLDTETHRAVFGGLPSTLSGELRTPEVGDLVLQLLDAGWRRGQLASRIAALPAGPRPLAEISALLRGFLDQIPPDARWQQEKAARRADAVTRSLSEVDEPASDASRDKWLGEIRAQLSGPRRARTATPHRLRPPCSLCGEESGFFVTRDVRLCSTCVGLLASGGVRLVDHDGSRPVADAEVASDAAAHTGLAG